MIGNVRSMPRAAEEAALVTCANGDIEDWNDAGACFLEGKRRQVLSPTAHLTGNWKRSLRFAGAEKGRWETKNASRGWTAWAKWSLTSGPNASAEGAVVERESK